MKKYYLFILLLYPVFTYCQTLNVPLNSFNYWNTDKNLHQKGNNFHSSVKPYNLMEIQNYFPADSFKLPKFIKTSSGDTSGKKNSVSLTPYLYLAGGYNLKSQLNNLETAIGLSADVVLGKRFAFQADYISSNSSYDSYTDSVVNEKRVIPGSNYAYGTKLGWCSKDLNFYLSYNISKYFNVQAGKGKNFFGEGYRSLLLSDNSASYPMFKITTTIWRIKYVNLYTMFNDVSESGGKVSKFKGKYSAMHYLSINLTKRINFGFFEAIVWQAKDSNNTRGFDVNYLNPVVFYRPVEFSLGSPDNALMGFNLSYLYARNQQFYAQFIMDEFNLSHIRNQDGWWANKQAYQAGLKSFDLFRIKNLMFQAEFNYIRPYTYSHISPTQNYGHYNQALAHPLGANLQEAVSFLRYKYNHFYFEAQFSYIIMGSDTGNVNYGGNIYKSYLSFANEYNNFVGQGLKNTIMLKSFKVYYLLFPKLDWNIYLTVSDLSIENLAGTKNYPYFSMGISSYLRKPYLGMF